MEKSVKKIKLLAVDDEKFNLLLLREALKNEEIIVEGCESADRAVELIKSKEYDVALLDVIMPGINGFELRNLIRQYAPRLPIIYLTAVVDTIDNDLVEKIAEDKFTYYMKKPFVRTELLRHIRNAVEDRQREDQTKNYYNNLEQDLELASEVQELMLPDWCVQYDDFFASSIYQPCQKVSGDIFDVIKIAPRKFFVLVGDIAGHGIQAALYMSAVQSLIKMIFGRNPADIKLCEILNRMNMYFCTELGQGNYMTCIAAYVNYNTNQLNFYSAGHPNISEYSPKREKLRMLNSENKGGIPIGWEKSFEYCDEEVVKVDIEDDSLLFAVTDGVFEIADRKSDEMLGMENLQCLLESISTSKNAAVIPYRLREAMRQMGYERNADDFCLLTMGRFCDKLDEKRLALTTPPVLNSTNQLVVQFGKMVEENTDDSELAGKVEILIGEFLNNVVIHGLGNRQQSRPVILVDLIIRNDVIEISVLDKGKNWNVSSADNQQNGSDLEESFATSGRGMAIICSIASSISRNRYGEINETCFVIDRKDQQNADT
ncbi:MAG: SpoIIE family protein phosphatase [Lentisphaerae bacterium]|nr:SpoIIE family protein phosphatase [Lentisphaerota bacterium]MCP4103592.1 SpoIIE family protein phosphatase [Lentisphaerota bacterium]